MLTTTLFLTLVGTSVAQAGWTAPGISLTGSVAAGTLAVTQSGFDSLAVVYNSSTLSVMNVVTVKNTGTIPAPYTLTLSTPASVPANPLATGVGLRTVAVDSAAGCTTAALAASPANQNWTSPLVLTGSGATALAPGASVYFCVSSTITQAQRFALVGVSAVPTVTLTSSIGNWAIPASAVYATQTVANTLTPGAPVASVVGTTDRTTTFTWSPPADTWAISGYQVFRNGVLVGTTTAAVRTYTDTGLNVGTAYSYTIKAIDSAADASPASAATAITTLGANATSWYRVRNVGTGLCIDGENEVRTTGTAMISWGCKSPARDNQAWNFSRPTDALGSGTGSVVKGSYAPLLVWDTSTNSGGAGTRSSALAKLITLPSGGASKNQSWWIIPVGAAGSGTYSFVNDSNQCLDVSYVGNATTKTPTGNVELMQQPCGVPALPSQTFTLTWVG